MEVGVLLFGDFETPDVYGPVEILGRLTNLYGVQFADQIEYSWQEDKERDEFWK